MEIPSTTDYLIIGQGLCGTWLSYYLMQAGASVIVIDKGTAGSASHAASGIINPITGKRLARQWMADAILPFASQAYQESGSLLNAIFAREISIHNFFANAEDAAFFEQKSVSTHQDVLQYSTRIRNSEHFNFHYGIGTICPALLVNVPLLLQQWRTHLISTKQLIADEFDWSECLLTENAVHYKGITAKAVIDCGGAATMINPYFSRLPFALNKGEVITASIPGLPRDAIYKYAQLSIVPWMDDRFWLGSTYDWDFTDELPTRAFREKVKNTLKEWLRLPFSLHDHVAAIRPATVTRDAFSGLHPHHPQVGILNGMGSKGCSLAPFLSNNLAEHLVNGLPLIEQVDVRRYWRVLAP